MPLSKLTTDLDYHQTLGDQPNANDGLTPDELKARYDQAANDIKTYINDTLTVEIDGKIAFPGTFQGEIIAARTSSEFGVFASLPERCDNTDEVIAAHLAENAKKLDSFVTPQMFGAVGDGVVDDGLAIQNAIDYLATRKGGIIHFPNGKYKCVNRAFVIPTGLITLEGETNSRIISEGLPTGVFISLQSPTDMALYEQARTPLRNITIQGNYFTNNPLNTSGVIGVSWGAKGDGSASTVVPCHASLINVVIYKFCIGLLLNTAYKSTAFNLSIIACDIGLWSGTGTNIPWHCHNIYIECCGKAIVNNSGDFTTLHFIGGAIEYNRVNYWGKAKVVFDNIKFEFDMRACCDNALNMLTPFEATDSYSTQICFNNCQFTIIDNYDTNVNPWIDPIIRSEALPTYVFKINAASTATNCSLVLTNCQYTATTLQTPASGNLISNTKGNVIQAFDVNKEYKFVLSSDDNLLFPAQMSVSPVIVTSVNIIGNNSLGLARLNPSVDCTVQIILVRTNADATQTTKSINTLNLTANVNNYISFPLLKGYDILKLYFNNVATLTNSVLNLF